MKVQRWDVVSCSAKICPHFDLVITDYIFEQCLAFLFLRKRKATSMIHLFPYLETVFWRAS